MLRVAEKLSYYTADEAAELLRTALDVVGAVNPPDDLREACFHKAADLLAAGHRTVEQLHRNAPAMAIPRG